MKVYTQYLRERKSNVISDKNSEGKKKKKNDWNYNIRHYSHTYSSVSSFSAGG